MGARLTVANISTTVAAVAANVRAAIFTNSGRYEPSEPIVLASGSTFALSLVSNIKGRVQVYAVAPDGHISRIWSGNLVARQERLSPTLRLKGMRGLETLRIVFVPTEGGEEQSGPSVIRSVSILHI